MQTQNAPMRHAPSRQVVSNPKLQKEGRNCNRRSSARTSSTAEFDSPVVIDVFNKVPPASVSRSASHRSGSRNHRGL